MLRNSRSFALMFVFALGLALAATAAGQTAQAATDATPTKVGIVAVQQAIAATNEGKKDLEALQKKFEPKQVEVKNMSDEIEKLKSQLQAQGDKLSEDAKANLARSIDSKQKILQRTVQDAQEEFQTAQQEIFSRVGGKMGPILEKYAVKNGYGVILDVSNPQTPVLYASAGTNITKEIVDAYNAQAGAAAPKSTGTATQPKPAGAGAAKSGPASTGGSTAAAAKSGSSATTKRP